MRDGATEQATDRGGVAVHFFASPVEFRGWLEAHHTTAKELWVGRARARIEAERMRPAGLAAFRRRREDRERQYSFEQGKVSFGEELEAQFRANMKAWAFFEAQPPSYRKNTTWWVVSAKREDTPRKRLATLIRDSEAGKRVAGA